MNAKAPWKEVREEARRQLAEEYFREAVEREKARLRAHRPFLHRLFPFTIKIVRR